MTTTIPDPVASNNTANATTVVNATTDGNDAIGGDGGGDFLYGQGGIDMLNGGPGADQAYGGDGGDTIYGDDVSTTDVATRERRFPRRRRRQ